MSSFGLTRSQSTSGVSQVHVCMKTQNYDVHEFSNSHALNSKDTHYRVGPPLSRHHWNQKKCPLRRGVCLWEVKNVVFLAGTMTKCPLMGGVHLRRCPLADVQLQMYWRYNSSRAVSLLAVQHKQSTGSWHGKVNPRIVTQDSGVEDFSLVTLIIQLVCNSKSLWVSIGLKVRNPIGKFQ